jgi:organic radical activating enzyme
MSTKKKADHYLKYKERMIDTVSDSFCAAKWYNATIWLGHGQTASCHHPPGHWIDKEEIKTNPSAIHNTQHKKKMRQMMLEGKRPQECEYCWKVEDIGRQNTSDRIFKTIIYKDEDVKKLSQLPWDADVDLKTLEIAFDRACNFACSYCNPAFSSTWVKDIKDKGPYNNIQSDGRGHFADTAPWAARSTKREEDNPYIVAFWKWWESSLSESLEEIRVTGGEPLMHKSVWQLFDWFKQHPESKMRFAINSNLVPEKKSTLDRFIEASHHIPHLEVYTSNESMGAQSEYIRDGMNYDRWYSNMERLVLESNVNQIHCMMTINALCLESITEFMSQMIAFRKQYGNHTLSLSLNILRFPSFQSAAVLPQELKAHFREKLSLWFTDNEQDVLPHEVGQIQRLIDYLDVVKTPHKDTAEKDKIYNDFRFFYEQYDRRRGKDFRKSFPTFVPWYDSIRYDDNLTKSSVNAQRDPSTTDEFYNDDLDGK